MGFGCDKMKDNEPFEIKALRFHNEFREAHSSPELTLDQELSNMAHEYAQKLFNSQDKEEVAFNLYKKNLLGENVYIGKREAPEEICKIWYKEIKKYDFEKNGYQKGTGHFTQIVWKETKSVGFGLYPNNKDNNKNNNNQNKNNNNNKNNKKICFVALYHPAGNTLGEFSNNVQKIKK